MALWETFCVPTPAPRKYGKQEAGHLNHSNSRFCVNITQGTINLVWPCWVCGIRQDRVHPGSNRLFPPVSLVRQGLFCVCGIVISLITDKFLLHIYTSDLFWPQQEDCCFKMNSLFKYLIYYKLPKRNVLFLYIKEMNHWNIKRQSDYLLSRDC